MLYLHLLGWLVVRLDCLRLQLLPVQVLEKYVLLQLLVPAALTVLGASAQQLLDEGLA